VGELVSEDKLSEAPEDTGEASEAPSAPNPEELMHEAIEAEEKTEAAEAPAPEAEGGDEEAVVVGTDDTSMAPSTDPIIEALKADPRFASSTFDSKETFFDSVHQLRSALSQRDEDAILGREVKGNWDDFQKFQESQQQEQSKAAFNPPPMPIGMDVELQKPEAERDPVKVEQYNARTRYNNDRWSEWMQEPNKLLSDLILPAVEKLTGEMLATQNRRTQLESELKPHTDYINQHGAEITQIMQSEGVTNAKVALELHQLRSGTKPVEAAKARKADAARIAGDSKGPRVSAPARRPAATEVNLLDPQSIVRAELEKGPVDPTPLTAD